MLKFLLAVSSDDETCKSSIRKFGLALEESEWLAVSSLGLEIVCGENMGSRIAGPTSRGTILGGTAAE